MVANQRFIAVSLQVERGFWKFRVLKMITSAFRAGTCRGDGDTLRGQNVGVMALPHVITRTDEHTADRAAVAGNACRYQAARQRARTSTTSKLWLMSRVFSSRHLVRWLPYGYPR